MVQPPWKTVLQCPLNIDSPLPYNPDIPPLGIHPQEMKTYSSHRTWAHLLGEALDTSRTPINRTGQTNCCIVVLWNSIQQGKMMEDVGESCSYDDEQKQRDQKQDTLCESVYLKFKNRQNEPMVLTNRIVAPSGRWHEGACLEDGEVLCYVSV